MPLDVHAELEGIKSRVPPDARPAAYKALVRRLEQAQAQATLLPVRQRLSAAIHLVKVRARAGRDWS